MPTDASQLGREGPWPPSLQPIESRSVRRIELGIAPSPPDDETLYVSADGMSLGVDNVATFDGGGGGSSLPPLWTTDDATSEITGTATATNVALSLTASDDDSAALDLRPAAGGSFGGTALIQLYDDAGVKIGDWDAAGSLWLYDLPNLTNTILFKEGAIEINITDATAHQVVFKIATVGPPYGGRLAFFVAKPGSGQAVVIPGIDPGDILFQVQAAAGQTADIVQFWDLNFDGNTRFDKDARLITRVHSAPADGEIAAGDCAMWFDQTDGAAKVMFKGKTANGTVAVGSVNLT